MATKAFRRFEQRITSYYEDLELTDLLVSRFMRSRHSQDSLSVSLGSDAQRHPYLARRVNNRSSKTICGTHLKATLHTAYIKELYEDFSEYISNIMANAALAGVDPSRFIGNVKVDVKATDLLKAGSWDVVVRLISDDIFRKLENERSTIELIRKSIDRLGLNINIQTLNDAMPYLDARHIFVHRDGKTDDDYRRKYPGIRLRDNKIIADFSLVSSARQTIWDLAKAIDDNIIAANLVRRQDINGAR